MASNQNDFWNESLELEPELTDREKAVRDLFVDQYVKDYSPVAAAMRCGFMRMFAEQYAQKFMAEAYVRKRIQAVELGETDTSKSSVKKEKAQILAHLRKVAYSDLTPSAARVAALKMLAELHGIAKSDGGTGGPAGGVIEVPAIASLDEWEKVAVQSQSKLVEDARS